MIIWYIILFGFLSLYFMLQLLALNFNQVCNMSERGILNFLECFRNRDLSGGCNIYHASEVVI